MVIRQVIWVVLLFVFAYSASHAEEKVSREQQRTIFKKAERVAHNPNSLAYKKYMRQLQGYPLKPYVELKTLSKFPFMANKQQIAAFLATYEGSPLDRPLRRKWLRYLHKQKQTLLFKEFYRDVGDVPLKCHYAELLLQQPESKQQGLAIAKDLWVVGKSQPKECDSLFRQWKKNGQRTTELVLQRLALAADGGDHTLIPYLKTLLPQQQKYLADLWLKVRRSPSAVSRLSHFPANHVQQETKILVYGLQRLISLDRDLALRSWDRLSKKFAFSALQQKQITHRFAIFLALADHAQAEVWLEKATSNQPDAELLRWHLAHVLRKQDWQHALDVINYVPEDLARDNVFQYWRARAYEQVDAQELATKGLQKLARERHYYGFLASAKLAKTASLNDAPIDLAQAEIDQLSQHPAAQRAIEFRHLKRNISARREWFYLQGLLTPQQKLTAAVMASQQGWHDQAIFGFAKSGYLDDLSRRFPMPFETDMQNYANRHNVDLAWAFAIARRESSFMPDAASGAGALGLMQVMPGTARYLAKKKVPRKTLFNPTKNAELGTQYMRYLLDKMDNNVILATASYNAGWRRVTKWLPEDNTVPMDLWVETIPYKETRNYVKAVLAYQQIYRQHLGNEENLFKDLIHMQIAPKS